MCVSEAAIAASQKELETTVFQCANILADSNKAGPELAQRLCQEAGEQTLRMAMSILANAILFHSTIADEYKIPSLPDFMTTSKTVLTTDLLLTWRHILNDINYWPIFAIAHDILALIPQEFASRVLLRMNRMVEVLGPLGITTQNDLCGRMFQRLITDRKFLATFYTLPSSASLLAEIAISHLEVDWSNLMEVEGLRIADFACGTGALLAAAYRCIAFRVRRGGLDDAEIHATVVEKVLTGADIMPAATHLTSSILSSSHPGITFKDMNIVTMPYGEPKAGSGHALSLGSLDLIENEHVSPLFGSGSVFLSGSGQNANVNTELPHESFDLVIMNPPFTRPTGHEASKIGVPVPSFAGFQTSDEEQRKMSKRLADLNKHFVPKRGIDTVGSGQAGLASNFIDLVEAKLKNGTGIAALVLPATFVNGEAWTKARKLLMEYYDHVTMIAIAEEGFQQQSFSADTGMAEVLIVGRKRNREPSEPATVLYVNLFHKPQTIIEASEFARQITLISNLAPSGTLCVGDQEVGHYIRGRPSESNFLGVRDLQILSSIASLKNGALQLPRSRNILDLPLTKLQTLGKVGPYHMDVSGKEVNKEGQPRGPFDIKPISKIVSTYPILWGHSAPREKKLVVAPDAVGYPRYQCEGRALTLWERTATRLHFNRDFGLSSQPLAACVTAEKSLGGRAWPSFKCHDLDWEIPIVLWANTTLGLMLFWWLGTRQQPGRSSVSISKLPELLVLNPLALNDQQLTLLHATFEVVKEQEFLPANESYRDETRIWLDHRILFDVLQLPRDLADSLNLIRRKWSSEPSVHGGKKTRPSSIS